MNHYTYLYIDPKNNKEMYVGKGTDDRAWVHRYFASNKKLYNTIKKRIREGYTVEPIINYEADEQTALEMEKFWINFYGREDLGLGTLFNLTDGGEGASGVIQSEETKAKRKVSLTGQKRSDEAKANMSLAQTGRTVSEEAREKLRLANLGKKLSQETISKIKETKEKNNSQTMPPNHTGRKRSEETKDRMRAAAKTRPIKVQTEEEKQKRRNTWALKRKNKNENT